MRKTQREAAPRLSRSQENAVSSHQGLDPVAKEWLDELVIPILLKKLRQEWYKEKAA